jgi:peptidoglycan L-alanyl-D-glutamate endopeptidase CwlK
VEIKVPHFNEKSKKNLKECNMDLQRLFFEVIKHFDCSVTCGHRGKEKQDELFMATPQRTHVRWPNSKHNSVPSLAVDVTPYPVDYEDRERQTLFAGVVLGVASQMGIKIRWGGDWDSDTEVDDNRFDDLPHFELIQPQ